MDNYQQQDPNEQIPPKEPYQNPYVRPEQPGKGLATVSHILGLFTGVFGPLIIYLMTESDKPFAKTHAAEALNFQITLLIAYAASFVLTFILIGILGFVIFGILDLVFCIMGTIAANNNESFTYPVSIRLIKP